MNIIYNTQENIATNIKNFLLKVGSNIRKSQLKIIPFMIGLLDLFYLLIKLNLRDKRVNIIFDHISSLGHTFVIRIKNIYKILIFNKRSKYKIWHSISDLNAQKYKSKLFYNIELTDSKYPVNLVISKSIDIKKPWIIITNSDPKRAIKDYDYRFGGIESIFKNQKSNGFYLESSVNCSLKYFESMYSLTCFSTLFLTIFGADYTKNSAIYKNVKLTTHKRFKDGFKRITSLFNIGLTLFHMALNSNKYIRIPFLLLFIMYES